MRSERSGGRGNWKCKIRFFSSNKNLKNDHHAKSNLHRQNPSLFFTEIVKKNLKSKIHKDPCMYICMYVYQPKKLSAKEIFLFPYLISNFTSEPYI